MPINFAPYYQAVLNIENDSRQQEEEETDRNNIRCSYCGQLNDVDAKVCLRCNAPLPKPKISAIAQTDLELDKILNRDYIEGKTYARANQNFSKAILAFGISNIASFVVLFAIHLSGII